MRSLVIVMTAVPVITISSLAADEPAVPRTTESYLVIRHFDHANAMSYKVMTPAEYKALTDQMAAEAKAWDKAMAFTQDAWKYEFATQKKVFPRSAITPIRVTIIDKFTDQARAASKAAYLASEDESKKKAVPAKPVVKKADDKTLAEKESLRKSAVSIFEGKLAEVIAATAAREEAARTAAQEKAAQEAAMFAPKEKAVAVETAVQQNPVAEPEK